MPKKIGVVNVEIMKQKSDNIPKTGCPLGVACPPRVMTCEWSAVTTKRVSAGLTISMAARRAVSMANVSSRARKALL